mgnify:CR=1 FL=1
MTAPTLGLTFIPAPLWRPVADVDDAPLNFGNKKPGIAPGFFYNSCNRGAATRPVAIHSHTPTRCMNNEIFN